MSDQPKKFKSSPKRYHPKGITILYEDHDILVADKIYGLLAVGNDKVKSSTAHYLLNEYVRKGDPKSKKRIFIVHRLDKDTSGIIVFAKTEKAQQYLQDEWDKFTKKYYAVVYGNLKEKEGVITSYLAENSVCKMYSVDDPGKGKLAKTGFKVLSETKSYSLLDIELFTGRKNQIRVHFAEKGFPVVGDKKYGKKEKIIKRLALHSYSLTILHPYSKKLMTFETKIPSYFNFLMRETK